MRAAHVQVAAAALSAAWIVSVGAQPPTAPAQGQPPPEPARPVKTP